MSAQLRPSTTSSKHPAGPNLLENEPSAAVERDCSQWSRIFQSFIDASSKFYGVILMIVLAYYVSWYLGMLHENLLWFSNIREVEREISFRTEQGLYYSFYKQIVNNRDFFQALQDLKVDNVTESGRIINVFNRFNIFQEVLLAAVYKFFDVQRYTAPILFYVRSVFILQAVFAVGIYLNAWILGRSFLAGVLAVCYFVCHKNDTTRVNYSVPLRESFAIPFIFCQLAVVSLYLRHGIQKWQTALYVFGVSLLTFLYTAMWQFTQFVSLMQIGTLYVLAISQQISRRKVLNLFLVHTVCLWSVCVLQFGNTMLLTSLAMSFVPFAFVSLLIQGDTGRRGIRNNVIACMAHFTAVLVAAFTLNYFLKLMLSDGSDRHIFKFIMGKLGVEDIKDFESRLYLCNDAFKFVENDTYVRLCGGLLLPIFCLVMFVWMTYLIYRALTTWTARDDSNNLSQELSSDGYPVLAYHTIQTVSFALVAMTTMRMKCLWVPHVCIVAAAGITNVTTWRRLGEAVSKKGHLYGRAVTILLIAYLVKKLIPFIQEQMEDLNEFWDPDTIELMEWIQNNTPSSATFAGSMQLLAGVKLCTGRRITNHPHFEDSWLRKRTLQVYQMYAKQPPELVYELLRSAGATYIILEDAICLTPSENHCHLVDILDLHNGHVPDLGVPDSSSDLVNTPTPRFCDEIRHGGPPFSMFFKPVFTNKTFRIYQLLIRSLL